MIVTGTYTISESAADRLIKRAGFDKAGEAIDGPHFRENFTPYFEKKP